MIHSFEFKSFYTCDTWGDTAYAIVLYSDKYHFIYNEKKRSRLFNRTFYEL